MYNNRYLICFYIVQDPTFDDLDPLKFLKIIIIKFKKKLLILIDRQRMG